jgi:hypothetical protein
MDSLPERIDRILSDRELAEHIASQGYDLAAGGHTWEHRACSLHEYMQQ